MDTIPPDSAEMDGKGKEISQYCLGLPTILRRILEQVSNKQLIQLSLVNKLWNFEARSVLRARGNLIAYFSRGGYGCACQELEVFASDLDKMCVVPFSGLHFATSNRAFCKSLSNRSLQPSRQIILDRVHWKQFFVQCGFNYWENYKGCPALLLIKQVLEDFGGVLEEVDLGSANEQFLGPIFKDRTLPYLKSLSVQAWPGTLSTTFVKKMVSCAPNLHELHVNAAADLGVNILEGSSAVLLADFELFPLWKPICEGLIGSIRSVQMTILMRTDWIDLEIVNRVIPKLLEASHATLKTLITDYLFAVPLMCYGVCLENVTTLKIHMNSDRLGDIDFLVLGLPRGLDFTRVFPNLTEVKILNDYGREFSSDAVSAFFQQASAVLRTTPPDRATNIKHLDLDGCCFIHESLLPVLGQMFQDVKTVHTKKEHQGALFEDLREHFLSLEQVTESENGMAFWKWNS